MVIAGPVGDSSGVGWCSRVKALLGHLELEGQVCPKYLVIYYIIALLGGGFCWCCWEQVADGSF